MPGSPKPNEPTEPPVAPRIAAVLFDIGGVFLHPDPTDRPYLSPDLAATITDDTLDWYSDQHWEDYKRGLLTEELYWTIRSQRLERHTQVDWLTLRDWDDEAVRLDTAVVELAAALPPGVRRAALSNAGAELERRLARYGLLPLFELVVNSHRVGMAKPEPEIYAYTANALGLEPQHILFVDDKARNIEAAASLGFLVHLHDSADNLRRCFQDLGLVT